MIELAILIILLVVFLVAVNKRWIAMEGFTDTDTDTYTDNKKQTEGFETAPEDPEYRLTACPAGFTTFYDSTGNPMCCDGELVGNKCIQGKQCTLSSIAAGSAPTCVSLLRAHYQEKSQEMCPLSMPMYYENKATKEKGCTGGPLLSELNGPRHASQPTCKVYPTLQENMNAKDSCHNHRKMDEFSCFGTDCRKEIVQTAPDAPAMIAVHFTDPTGMFRTSYTRESMENFLNHTKPHWRDQGLDLSKNVQVAEVAKAYYVDKSIQDVQV